jgi:negative regulator of replication initiation
MARIFIAALAICLSATACRTVTPTVEIMEADQALSQVVSDTASVSDQASDLADLLSVAPEPIKQKAVTLAESAKKAEQSAIIAEQKVEALASVTDTITAERDSLKESRFKLWRALALLLALFLPLLVLLLFLLRSRLCSFLHGNP